MRDNSILLRVSKAVFRLLASLKLAVTLIVLLAAILAAATFVESDKGRDYAAGISTPRPGLSPCWQCWA